jgi:predicted nucleic acid-binding protein
MIPTYLEIEGKNWDDVKKVAGKLGLKWKDKKKMAAMQVYRLYGIEEKDYSIITFDKQIKRKK